MLVLFRKKCLWWTQGNTWQRTTLNQEDQSARPLQAYGKFYGGGFCFVKEQILKISRNIVREEEYCIIASIFSRPTFFSHVLHFVSSSCSNLIIWNVNFSAKDHDDIYLLPYGFIMMIFIYFSHIVIFLIHCTSHKSIQYIQPHFQLQQVCSIRQWYLYRRYKTY